MKYLGIDYGSKRVGLSLSDEEGRMAFPRSVVDTGRVLDEIQKIIKREKVEKIVIGESTDFAGKPNEIMKEIKKFAANLGDKSGLEVIFEPEFWTSVQAKRLQEELRGKGDDHASAAALILQSYLDRIK